MTPSEAVAFHLGADEECRNPANLRIARISPVAFRFVVTRATRLALREVNHDRLCCRLACELIQQEVRR